MQSGEREGVHPLTKEADMGRFTRGVAVGAGISWLVTSGQGKRLLSSLREQQKAKSAQRARTSAMDNGYAVTGAGGPGSMSPPVGTPARQAAPAGMTSRIMTAEPVPAHR
jgi:hypothetical protein